MDRKARKFVTQQAPLAILLALTAFVAAMLVFTGDALIATLTFGIGMAVTADQLINRGDDDRGGGPVAASTTLYQGTLAFWNVSGYLDDDTGTGANRFAGIVVRNYDNSSGSNGDISADLHTRGRFLLTGTGFSQASVGYDAFATDNYTVTAAPSASGVRIGKITGYVSSTQVYVTIEVDDENETGTVQTKTTDYTVTTADSGRTFSTAGASGTVVFTLPAAVPGLKYRFRVGAAQELRLDPDGTETISLPSTGVPGAAGKYLTANAAGETVEIECVVAGTWSVFGFTGTWTAEP